MREFKSAHRFSPSAEDALLGLLVLARVFSGRAESVMQEMDEMRACSDLICESEN